MLSNCCESLARENEKWDGMERSDENRDAKKKWKGKHNEERYVVARTISS